MAYSMPTNFPPAKSQSLSDLAFSPEEERYLAQAMTGRQYPFISTITIPLSSLEKTQSDACLDKLRQDVRTIRLNFTEFEKCLGILEQAHRQWQAEIDEENRLTNDLFAQCDREDREREAMQSMREDNGRETSGGQDSGDDTVANEGAVMPAGSGDFEQFPFFMMMIAYDNTIMRAIHLWFLNYHALTGIDFAFNPDGTSCGGGDISTDPFITKFHEKNSQYSAISKKRGAVRGRILGLDIAADSAVPRHTKLNQQDTLTRLRDDYESFRDAIMGAIVSIEEIFNEDALANGKEAVFKDFQRSGPAASPESATGTAAPSAQDVTEESEMPPQFYVLPSYKELETERGGRLLLAERIGIVDPSVSSSDWLSIQGVLQGVTSTLASWAGTARRFSPF